MARPKTDSSGVTRYSVDSDEKNGLWLQAIASLVFAVMFFGASLIALILMIADLDMTKESGEIFSQIAWGFGMLTTPFFLIGLAPMLVFKRLVPLIKCGDILYDGECIDYDNAMYSKMLVEDISTYRYRAAPSRIEVIDEDGNVGFTFLAGTTSTEANNELAEQIIEHVEHIDVESDVQLVLVKRSGVVAQERAKSIAFIYTFFYVGFFFLLMMSPMPEVRPYAYLVSGLVVVGGVLYFRSFHSLRLNGDALTLISRVHERVIPLSSIREASFLQDVIHITLHNGKVTLRNYTVKAPLFVQKLLRMCGINDEM